MSAKIRFVHTADIHFGVENYGRIDPETGIHTRLLDFERALGYVIDHAIDHDVDFFVFSGDAYKTPYPTPTQQKLLLKQFMRLHERGIPLVIIVGNHDHPLSFGRAHALDVFGAIQHKYFYVCGRPRSLRIETKSGPVQIVGIPWPLRNNLAVNRPEVDMSTADVTRTLSQAITSLIHSYARELDPRIPSILAGHLTVSTGIFSGSEKQAIMGTDPVFLPSQLAIAPFDYVALGHLHRHQNLNKGGIPVVYAGSPERVDFGERKEPKGFCVGEILVSNEGKKTTNYEFFELPVRPMIQIDVALRMGADFTEQILSAIREHDLVDAIVKVVYTVPAAGKDTAVDTAKIQRACRDAHFLVGIVPIHEEQRREHRRHIREHMSFDEAFRSYAEHQGKTPAERDALLSRVREMLTELENEETRSDESV